jgi:menaquinone-dependent protoporphyrinogen oxidase
MSKYLIVYGTRDGQTAKIARAIGEEFRKTGRGVDELDAGKIPSDFDVEAYDGVIAGGGIQAGGYPKALIRFAQGSSQVLSRKPGAFFSVCLGILEKENPKAQSEVRRFVTDFMDKTGWHPEEWRIFAGSLAYTHYGWLKKRVMRWIAKKAGGSTDMTRDHEYTDWNQVREFSRVLLSKWP